jgi:transposase-like protein
VGGFARSSPEWRSACERTAYRWLRRFREESEAGLLDRCSAPKRIPHKTPAERAEAIEALRRLRMTGAEIAESLSMPLSTVSAWLRRIGLGKRSRLEPQARHLPRALQLQTTTRLLGNKPPGTRLTKAARNYT